MIVEMAPFKTRPHVSVQQMQEASQAFQREFLQNQPGFCKRELLKGKEDNAWLDVVHWENENAAHAVMEAAMKSEACATYFSLMEQVDHQDLSQGVSHFHSIATYQ